MKTIYKLLILSFVLLFAHVTRAQDTTKTDIGYDLDYPYVHIKIDTVHSLARIYSYYPHAMLFSVNGGKAVKMKRKEVMSAWSEHFTLMVIRKNYKRTYQI